jgi:hypothetical protein
MNKYESKKPTYNFFIGKNISDPWRSTGQIASYIPFEINFHLYGYY